MSKTTKRPGNRSGMSVIPMREFESEEQRRILEQALANGCSERMAEMLASRKAPSCNTDSTWWGGNTHFSKEHGEQYADRTKKLVEANGGTMGPRDDYVPWMAKYPGDPDAVVSGQSGPREKIQDGLTRQANAQIQRAQQPRVPLAEKLVDEKLDAIARDNPEVKQLPPKEKTELREQIIEKHAYNP